MLSKALAETYKAKPLEPKKYFAKYLLSYAAQKRKQAEVSRLVNEVGISGSAALR